MKCTHDAILLLEFRMSYIHGCVILLFHRCVLLWFKCMEGVKTGYWNCMYDT